MGGITNSTKPVYHCRRYHAAGSTACHRNVVEEAPLVAAVVRKIQEEYLSDSALARLRRSLAAGQDQTGPRLENLARLRREIDDLDRKIDQGAARALEAPADLLPILYGKLEAWRGDRDRLKADLETLACRQAGPNRKNGSEIDETIDALRDLSKAFRDAEPEDIRELLASIVTRIELHFTHETRAGGREQNVFAYGTIHIRPDAGESRSSDPASSHLNTNGLPFDTRTTDRRLQPAFHPEQSEIAINAFLPKRLACPKMAIENSRRDHELIWEDFLPKAISDKALRPIPHSSSSRRCAAESGRALLQSGN
jgi:hypothetical protein